MNTRTSAIVTRFSTCLLAAGVSSHLATTLQADTLSVCLDGTCDFVDIQAAIDAASDGDKISISGETYLLGAALNTRGKSFELTGAVNGDGIPATILLGAGNHRLLTIEAGPAGGPDEFDSQVSIYNLVFRNGSAQAFPDLNGGAIWIDRNVYSKIENCYFAGCESADLGGAIYSSQSSLPWIERCIFFGNTALRGGAIYIDNSEYANVQNSYLYFNAATEEFSAKGGAIATVNCDTYVGNCGFIFNAGGLGAGIYCSETPDSGNESSFNNSLIVSNFGTGVHIARGTPTLDRSVVNGNFGNGIRNDGGKDSGTVLYDTQVCGNYTSPQTVGFVANGGGNCISTICDADFNNIPDCYQATGMGLPGPGGEAGPLVNTNFSEGEDGLDGWFAFNNAYGTSIGSPDWYDLPEGFESTVKLFGSYWGSENYSGVAQDICWEPGQDISFGADYVVRRDDQLRTINEQGGYTPSVNTAYVALNIFRLGESGAEELWYSVQTEGVTGQTMEPGVKKTMINNYAIPLEQADQVTRVQYAIIFRQFDNFDSGSVFFTNAFATCEAQPPCFGDFNGDLTIDGQDLTVLLAAWGPDDSQSPADLIPDGVIDGQDLAALLAVWGNNCGE